MASDPIKQITLTARLALFGAGIAVSLLTLEGAFRIAAPLLKPQKWSDRSYAYFIPEDAQTLQDVVPHPKAPGTFRIGVVGDSFTFGPNMQLSDTFPKRLQGMLNLNNGAPRVEVLNRGKTGASTEVEVELVRKALKEDLDLLVLEITLNDAEPHILTRAERDATFNSPWLKWKIFSVWKSLGFVATRFHNTLTVNRYIDYHSKFFKEPVTAQRFEAALMRIKAQAEAAKVPLLAMVFPLFDFPINDRYPFVEAHGIIHSKLEKIGISSIDLTRAYQNIPPARLQVIPGRDNHPNEIAHRIAAERLLAALVDRKLLPEATLPKRVFRTRKEMAGFKANREKVWGKVARGVTVESVARSVGCE